MTHARWRSLQSTLFLSAVVVSAAALEATDPCKNKDVQKALQADLQDSDLQACTIPKIRKNYFSSVDDSLDSVEIVADALVDGGQGGGLASAASSSRDALKGARQSSSQDVNWTSQMEILDQNLTQVSALLSGLTKDSVPAAEWIATCQAKLDLRRSEIWEEGLRTCPAPTLDSSDDEDSTESDNDSSSENDDPPDPRRSL